MRSVLVEFCGGPLDGRTCRMRLPLTREWIITINATTHIYRLARTYDSLIEYEYAEAK